MSTLVFAEERGGTLHVSRLQDGASIPADSPYDVMLISPLDCQTQLLEMPPVAENQVRDLLQFRIRTIYPGNPLETTFDYRVIPDRAAPRVALFIMKKQTLEVYRKGTEARPLVTALTVVEKAAAGRGKWRAWFYCRSTLQHFLFQDGMPVSITLGGTDVGDPQALAKAEKALPEQARDVPCAIIASAAAIAHLTGGTPGAEVIPGATFVTLESLAQKVRRSDGVFNPRQRKNPILSPKVRVAALAVILVAAGGFILVKYVSREEARAGSLKEISAKMEKQSRAALALKKEADDLSAKLAKLDAQKPTDMYRFLSEIYTVFKGEARLTSLSVQGGDFTAEAIGKEALRLMDGFKADGYFSDVRLTQVVPESVPGLERFSFLGRFNGR